MQVGTVDPRTTALLVVDAQNDFLAEDARLPIPAGRKVLPELKLTIEFCRSVGIKVIYTVHAHRPDGSDMGRMGVVYPVIKNREALVEGTKGVEVHPTIAPAPNEIVIHKHRHSAFFATDLDLILRNSGIETLVITGFSSTGCCHVTAREALFNDYKVVFLSDCTATSNFPDLGYGALTAHQAHRWSLVVLAVSSAHVMTGTAFRSKVATHRARRR